MFQDEINAQAQVEGWDNTRIMGAYETRAKGGDWTLDMQQPGGFTLPVQSPNKSIWEKHSGRHLALANQLANSARERVDLGQLMANARDGLTVEDQDRMEQEQRLKELTAQFVDATKDLDDDEYERAANDFAIAQGAPMPQRQRAELQTPNLMQSGFALLGAILDPQNAAQIVSQPFQYQLSEQQRQQGLNDQGYADQVRARGEAIDAAGARYQIEERRLGKAQASQDRKANMIRTQMGDVQRSIDKKDAERWGVIEKLFGEFNDAKTAEGKRIIGKALQQMTRGTGIEIPDQEIEAEAQAVHQLNAAKATRDWETALKAEVNAFGEIAPGRAAELNTQREAIASGYKVDPQILRTPPDGKTLAAEKLALAERQFSFLKTKSAQDFKVKWANYQVAKQRANSYAESVNNGYYLGKERNRIADGNLQLRAMELSMKDLATAAQKQYQSIINELNVLGNLPPSKENNEKILRKRSELQVLLENVAHEMGITTQEIMADPMGAISRFAKELTESETDMGNVKVVLPPAGNEPPATKTEQQRPNRKKTKKPAPMYQGGGLPKGWTVRGGK